MKAVAVPDSGVAQHRLFAATSPAGWAWYCSRGSWVMARHLAFITKAVLDTIRDGGRLLIECPPRMGKSELISRYLPGWFLGAFPGKRAVVASYSDVLPRRNGRHARADFAEHGPTVFGASVRDDTSAAHEWATTKGSEFYGVGVGGGLTGRGADCVASGTLVETERGAMRVEDFASFDNPPRVLSYDHARKSLAWSRVTAYRAVDGRDLVRVVLSDGRELRCTPDHRVHSAERGYVEAASLRRGEAVDCFASEQGPVCDLRRGDGSALDNLPTVLHDRAHANVQPDMRDVRGIVHAQGVRGGEAGSSGSQGLLLRRAVQHGAPRGQTRTSVRRMRRGACQEWQKVLREGVPSICIQASGAVAVSRVRAHGAGWQRASSVLRDSVQEQVALARDDGRRELALQGRGLLRQGFSGCAASGARQGQGDVRCVSSRGRRGAEQARGSSGWSAVDPASASHRRGREEQRATESRDAVQSVSPEASLHHACGEVVTVSVVERVRGEGQRVHDLQVEGTENFYANGVLVHNCLILDDLVKDAEAAQSEVQRDAVWDWLEQVALIRLEPGAAVIGITTRWHEDDAHGRLLERQPGRWRRIRLPAFAEENDPLGRAPGEALWPERYSAADLEEIRAGMSSRAFAALYQQSPSPAGGDVWHADWWAESRFDVLPDGQFLLDGHPIPLSSLRRFTVVDLATSTKTSADYTVFSTFGVAPQGRLLWLDCVRARMEGPDILTRLSATMARWGSTAAYIEDSGYQLSIIQDARRRSMPVRTWGRKLDASHRVEGDKVALAYSATPYVEQGRVYLPRSAPWVAQAEAELLSFPNGAHDDVADTFAVGVRVGIEMGAKRTVATAVRRAAPDVRRDAFESSESDLRRAFA